MKRAVALTLALAACDFDGALDRYCAGRCDGGAEEDAGLDAGAPDAGVPDAGAPDSGTPDAGSPDASAPDSGVPDAGTGTGTDFHGLAFGTLGGVVCGDCTQVTLYAVHYMGASGAPEPIDGGLDLQFDTGGLGSVYDSPDCSGSPTSFSLTMPSGASQKTFSFNVGNSYGAFDWPFISLRPDYRDTDLQFNVRALLRLDPLGAVSAACQPTLKVSAVTHDGGRALSRPAQRYLSVSLTISDGGVLGLVSDGGGMCSELEPTVTLDNTDTATVSLSVPTGTRSIVTIDTPSFLQNNWLMLSLNSAVSIGCDDAGCP